MIQNTTQQTVLASVPTSVITAASGDSVNHRPYPCDCQREEVRHILLGSPEAIRQTIYQLHVLNYAESLLWSPITTVGENLTITRKQGEAMSLLRRLV